MICWQKKTIGAGEAPLGNYLTLLLALGDRLVVEIRKGQPDSK
jgi:hypothetical protein